MGDFWQWYKGILFPTDDPFFWIAIVIGIVFMAEIIKNYWKR